jgi:hypothetical protein
VRGRVLSKRGRCNITSNDPRRSSKVDKQRFENINPLTWAVWLEGRFGLRVKRNPHACLALQYTKKVRYSTSGLIGSQP